jgi:hypothetical protein
MNNSDISNKTIGDYITSNEEILSYIQEKKFDISNEFLTQKINEIQTSIKMLQVTARRMADISNIMNQILYWKEGEMQNFVDPYPTPDEHSLLFDASMNSVEIVPGIKIAASTIEHEKEIPSILNVFYIKNLRQFGIRINGHLISGNIGNLCQYNDKSTSYCAYGTKCKNLIQDKKCRYYHPYNDYRVLGIRYPSENIKNFTYGSWLYSKKKDEYYRHIGNRATLLTDISNLKKVEFQREIQNREAQLMHDILVYLCLIRSGISSKFPDWIKYSKFLDNE